MQAVLVMFKADGDRRSFSLARDVTVVGRREDCDLRIPLGEVSRKHCRLIKDGESIRLEDLGSSNGTYLNGNRVQEAVVQPGDTIQIGPVVFVAQIDGMPADDQLQPMTASAETGSDGEAQPNDASTSGQTVEADPGEAEALAALNADEEALSHLSNEDSAHAQDSSIVNVDPPQGESK